MPETAADSSIEQALTLHRRGSFGEALSAYRQAVALAPDRAATYSNMGGAMAALGRRAVALVASYRAVRADPSLVRSWSNLASIFLSVAQADLAAACCRQALTRDPALPEALSNLSAILADNAATTAAAQLSCRAAILTPSYADALANLGRALRDLGRHGRALAVSRRAIALKPDLALAYSNQAVVLTECGLALPATATGRRAITLRPNNPRVLSNFLFALQYLEFIGRRQLAFDHHHLGTRFAAGIQARSHHDNPADPGRRLRIGYVSPDLRSHSVAWFLEPLLAAHDKNAVEVFLYAEVGRPDRVSERLRSHAGAWRQTVGLDDEVMGQMIVDDRIDILVDLAGHTAGNRLTVFAARPAPLQLTWLGYPDTTGLKAFDGRLVDNITDPTGEEELSTERLIRIDGGFLCYGPPPNMPALPRPCLSNRQVTFGSFNAPAKLSDGTINLWSRLLEQIPHSRLLLKGGPFGDNDIRALTSHRFARRGIAAERVDLLGQDADFSQHLALYGQIDIALDPFPYNGTTTTCEALWMGVPVVTLAGSRHAGRVGTSLLSGLDLGELIADTPERYLEIAANLAADHRRLDDISRSLRPRMTNAALTDAPAFARKIEAAYRALWHDWCATAGL